MGKKRILFITSELVYGGAEKMTAFLINSLSEEGYSVVVYSYEGKESNYSLDSRVEFIAEENIFANYFTRRFIQVLQVRKKVKEINPDVVISFLTNQNVFSIIGTRFTKIPVIISERGDPNINVSILARLKYKFYNFAEGLVFQTEDAKRYFNKRIQNKSVVIPNPVTSQGSYQPVNFTQRKNEIAYVARFEIKQKRQDLMIKAFKKVADKYDDLKLTFYGDGPDMLIIKNMVEEYNLTDKVDFLGKVDEIPNTIRDSKMFVLTSDYEGIPNALIEAMSVGLPVIATDCSPGGAKLLINNKQNGILVSRGDSSEIAEAITYFLENPEIAEKYGNEAVKIKDTFSPQKIINSWVDYINRIGDFNGN